MDEYQDQQNEGQDQGIDHSQNETAQREARQARRQAIYRERLSNQEGRERLQKVSDRYIRSEKNKKTLLSGENNPRSSKINTGNFVTLIMVAGFFDGLSLVLNLLPVVGGVASMIFSALPGNAILYLMYSRLGIDMKSARVAKRFWGSAIIEFVPVVNALPGMITSVLLVTASEKLPKI